MTKTIRAGFTTHAVIYHEVADSEVTALVTAIEADGYASLEVTVDIKTLEK